MANRIFAITAAHELVTLDDQGRSQVSFTASNTGPKSIPGRAKLVSLGSTKEAWLTLEGEAERNFAKGESHQFTAKIAVPPGTPMGKYSFRLNIISVENPDDEFTEGPSVSFEVKELAPAAPPKRKFPWWIVAVAGVLLVGAIIITLLLLPEKLTVPKVVGEPISKAKESLKDFASEVVGERVTGKYPPGVVVEQEPAEGTKAALGAKVALTVEANAVEVPKITGLSLADADAKLKKIKLQLKTDTRSANATTGTITEQDPKSGLRVAAGATVTALVEPEQQMVIVPDFIGVPIEKVPSMLPGNLGFQVNNPPIITGKVAIGAVAQQSPGKDQRVAPGTKIALTVEAESVEVPDLRGKQVGKAFDELNSKKLVPRYRDGDFAGKLAVLLPVAWQSPAPGTRVAPGTTITINAVP